MLNIPSNNSHSQTREFKLSALSSSERVLYWVIVLTPVWWLLGIQPLFYPGVMVFLLVRNFEIDKLVRGSLPLGVWAWLGMALVMLWTALLGIITMGFNVQVAAAAVVTFFKSYFLIFACLTIPFWSKVGVDVITRAVAWMSAGFLATTVIEVIMMVLRIGNGGLLPPLARLLPGDKSSLRIDFAILYPSFGLPLPRTAYYTPDPPIAGACALLCFIICLAEPNRRLRRLALAGSLCSLIISTSRLALICLPVALLIVACFRSPLVRQMSLWSTSLLFLFCSILERSLGDLIKGGMAAFDGARAESSKERGIVVSKTLEAWQEYPWLGWGVIRGQAHLYENTYQALGSFSTYSAVLYLHGIVGFIFLVSAMLLTLAFFYASAIQGNLLCKRAFASLFILYLLLNGEPLSWMAVNIWFFFVWLGAIMQETQQDSVSISSWEQLSGQK